jgi:hypothetical protein
VAVAGVVVAGCASRASERTARAPVPAPSPTPPPTGATATVATLPVTGPAVAPAPAPAPASAPAPAVTTDCTAALAYLTTHQAPGFVSTCGPGTALGHYGFTCWNRAPHCPDGGRIIHIACPAPFVYMNEAHNSWALTGTRTGIDPYGQGSPTEQAYCDRLR